MSHKTPMSYWSPNNVMVLHYEIQSELCMVNSLAFPQHFSSLSAQRALQHFTHSYTGGRGCHAMCRPAIWGSVSHFNPSNTNHFCWCHSWFLTLALHVLKFLLFASHMIFLLLLFADASGSLAQGCVCSPMLSLNPTWQSEPHLLSQFRGLN